jgi:hypothetical protein
MSKVGGETIINLKRMINPYKWNRDLESSRNDVSIRQNSSIIIESIDNMTNK